MRLRFSSPVVITALLTLAAVNCSSDPEGGPVAAFGNQAMAGTSSTTAGSAGTGGGGNDSSAGSTSVAGTMNTTAGTGGSATTAGAGGMGGMAGVAGMAMGGSMLADAGVAGSSFDAGAEEVDAGQPAPDEPEDPIDPEPQGPLVALTFDDGPNPNQTPDVLDRLEQYGVPASFFLIGQNINAGAQGVLDRAASLGCEFENHSNGFGALNNFNAQQIADSVNTTTQLIQQFTGQTPEFFRAPNLATSALMFQTIDLPFANGVLGNDFPGGNPQVQAIANAIINNVQDGSIILLHDSQPGLDPHPTPAALDIIIPNLQGQGYEFVTLRQLFELRGVDPNSQQDVPWSVVPPQNP